MSILQHFETTLENRFYNNIHVIYEEHAQIENGLIDLCMCDYYQPIHDCIYNFLKRVAQDCKTLSSLSHVYDVVDYIKCFTSYYDYYTIITPTDTIAKQVVEKRRIQIVQEHHNRITELILVFGKLLPPIVLTDIISLSLKDEIGVFKTMGRIERSVGNMELAY
jgi:hypothetical protein